MLAHSNPVATPIARIDAAIAKPPPLASASTAAGGSTASAIMATPVAIAWRSACGRRSRDAATAWATRRPPARNDQNAVRHAASMTGTRSARGEGSPSSASTRPMALAAAMMAQVQSPVATALRIGPGTRKTVRGVIGAALIRPPR